MIISKDEMSLTSGDTLRATKDVSHGPHHDKESITAGTEVEFYGIQIQNGDLKVKLKAGGYGVVRASPSVIAEKFEVVPPDTEDVDYL